MNDDQLHALSMLIGKLQGSLQESNLRLAERADKAHEKAGSALAAARTASAECAKLDDDLRAVANRLRDLERSARTMRSVLGALAGTILFVVGGVVLAVVKGWVGLS